MVDLLDCRLSQRLRRHRGLGGRFETTRRKRHHIVLAVRFDVMSKLPQHFGERYALLMLLGDGFLATPGDSINDCGRIAVQRRLKDGRIDRWIRVSRIAESSLRD